MQALQKDTAPQESNCFATLLIPREAVEMAEAGSLQLY